MTYEEALRQGKRELRDSGIRDADTDAWLLINHLTGKDRTFFLVHGRQEMPEREWQDYTERIRLRKKHVPLQFITGETEFMGLPFYVNDSTLIPRVDTEFLAEEVLKELRDGASVLDLCTGSGCILLSLMCYRNGIRGVGSDLSKEALDLAGKNAVRLAKLGKLKGKADFRRSDLFEELRGKFDFIVSNPPYIKTAQIDTLEDEVRLYEPRSALDGTADGLEFYRRIAKRAGDYLNENGKMFLEIGFDQGKEVREILKEQGYRNIEIRKDYSGNERVAVCLNR